MGILGSIKKGYTEIDKKLGGVLPGGAPRSKVKITIPQEATITTPSGTLTAKESPSGNVTVTGTGGTVGTSVPVRTSSGSVKQVKVTPQSIPPSPVITPLSPSKDISEVQEMKIQEDKRNQEVQAIYAGATLTDAQRWENIRKAREYQTPSEKVKSFYEGIDYSLGGWLPWGIKRSEYQAGKKAQERAENYSETKDALKDKSFEEIYDMVTATKWEDTGQRIKEAFSWKGNLYHPEAVQDVFAEKVAKEVLEPKRDKYVEAGIKKYSTEREKIAQVEASATFQIVQSEVNNEIEKIRKDYMSGKISKEERDSLSQKIVEEYNLKLENKTKEINEKLNKDIRNESERLSNEWWSSGGGETIAEYYSKKAREIATIQKMKSSMTIPKVAITAGIGGGIGAGVTTAIGLGVVSATAVKSVSVPLLVGGGALMVGSAGLELYGKYKEYGEVTGWDTAGAILPKITHTIGAVGGAYAGSTLARGVVASHSAKVKAQFEKDHKIEIENIKRQLITDKPMQNKYLTPENIKKGYFEVDIAGTKVTYKITQNTLNAINQYNTQLKLMQQGKPLMEQLTTNVGVGTQNKILNVFKNNFKTSGKYNDLSVGKIDNNLVSAITKQTIKGETWYLVSGKETIGGQVRSFQYMFKFSNGKIINPYAVSGTIDARTGIGFIERAPISRITKTGTIDVGTTSPLKLESLGVRTDKSSWFGVRVEPAKVSGKGGLKVTESRNILWEIKDPSVMKSDSLFRGVKWTGKDIPVADFFGQQRIITYDTSGAKIISGGRIVRIDLKGQTTSLFGGKTGDTFSFRKTTESPFLEVGKATGVVEYPTFTINPTKPMTSWNVGGEKVTFPKIKYPPKTDTSLFSATGVKTSQKLPSYVGGEGGVGSESIYQFQPSQVSTSLLSFTTPAPIIKPPVLRTGQVQVGIFNVQTTITPPITESFLRSSFAEQKTISLLKSDVRTTEIKQEQALSIFPVSTLDVLQQSDAISKTDTRLIQLPIQQPIQQPITTPPLAPIPQEPVQIPKRTTPKITEEFFFPALSSLGELEVGGGQKRAPSSSLFRGKTTYTPSLGSVLLRTPKRKVTKEEASLLGTEKFTGFELRPELEVENGKKKSRKGLGLF